MSENVKCKKGTRKLHGKCKTGSYKIINDKKKWVFDVLDDDNNGKIEKGTRKKCPRGTVEVIENGKIFCQPVPVAFPIPVAVPEQISENGQHERIKIPCGKRCPNKMRCINNECVATILPIRVKQVSENVSVPVAVPVVPVPVNKIPCGKRCPNQMRCIGNECVFVQSPPKKNKKMVLVLPEKVPSERVPSERVPSEKVPSEKVHEKVSSEKVPSEKVPSEKVPSEKVPSERVHEKVPEKVHEKVPSERVLVSSENEKASVVPFNRPITERDEYNRANDDDDTMAFLYPNLNDPHFNIKLSEKKEFNDIPFDNNIYNVSEKSEQFCENEKKKKEFEFLPHQLFVRNFMSQQTPYNSLLLYHSVGTGKTLSAISIAEDMRYYLRQLGIRKKIIIVCAPNVQKNFERQFFDETKLTEKKINNEKRWSINSGIGSILLKEINPTNNDTKEDIIKKVNKLRNKYYEFYGYGALRNEIENILPTKEDGKEGEKLFIKKMRNKFNNRLIIIDEVHNIHNIQNNDDNYRNTNNSEKKKLGTNILKISQYAENVRFILLSATPIYNSYSEIIFLANLMNVNDKRKKIDKNDVFDDEGNFKEEETLKNGLVKEGGKQLLIRKLSGYVSFVRGENPYTFPFRIYPNDIPHIQKKSILNMKYPTKQLNGEILNTRSDDGHIRFLDVYMSEMNTFQNDVYQQITESMIAGKETDETRDTDTDADDDDETEDEDNLTAAFSYNKLQKPLQALNIVFPNSDENIENSIGNKGLESIMEIHKKNNILNFKYKKTNYGEIFSPNEIGKYSSKIHSICNLINQSKGIVLVYAYYIYGGIIPLALALEELGFNRYSSNSSYKNLMKPQNNSGLNYLMITGNKELSSDNAEDVKYVSSPDNKDGQKVKVILISKSGSEGLDFKNIRQIHIMDSWYTLNRIEQIIGRGVRTLSHCNLPLEERCVEIYLHATLLKDREQESADLYMYRYAEKKAIQLGKIYRVLKQISIDCILNQGQQRMSVDDLKQTIRLHLSSLNHGKQIQIQYQIGDKPFTNICDYMDNCDYKCVPEKKVEDLTVNNYTYNNDFIKNNNNVIAEKIKALYRDKNKIVFTIDEIIFAINSVRQYPIEQIYYALTHLIKDKTEYLVDYYGRLGNLINKEKYYLFQPLEITDQTASVFERMNPLEHKQKSIMIPDGYKHSAVMFQMPKEDNKESSSSFAEIMRDISTKFAVAFGPKLTTKGKVWGEHLNFVLDELQRSYGLSLADIQKHFMFHLLDTFSVDQKCTILKKLESLDPSPYEKYIRLYFETKRIKKYAILYDKESDTNKFFVRENGSEEWKERQKIVFEEIMDQNQEIKSEYRSKMKPKMILKVDEPNGFMTKFKNMDVVFKVRAGLKDKGAYLSNGNKDIAIQIINRFLENTEYNNRYSNKTKFDKYELSVILEILMRDQKKRVFLSPEQYREIGRNEM
jgi:superfamily II DNA or RNA helicase